MVVQVIIGLALALALALALTLTITTFAFRSMLRPKTLLPVPERIFCAYCDLVKDQNRIGEAEDCHSGKLVDAFPPLVESFPYSQPTLFLL